jgi:hypothetical protein
MQESKETSGCMGLTGNPKPDIFDSCTLGTPFSDSLLLDDCLLADVNMVRDVSTAGLCM